MYLDLKQTINHLKELLISLEEDYPLYLASIKKAAIDLEGDDVAFADEVYNLMEDYYKMSVELLNKNLALLMESEKSSVEDNTTEEFRKLGQEHSAKLGKLAYTNPELLHKLTSINLPYIYVLAEQYENSK